jgi:SpoU rRNA methylase family enzyme
MSTDKALADSIVHWTVGGGDTGRGRVERIDFLQLRFTHRNVRNRFSGKEMDLGECVSLNAEIDIGPAGTAAIILHRLSEL